MWNDLRTKINIAVGFTERYAPRNKSGYYKCCYKSSWAMRSVCKWRNARITSQYSRSSFHSYQPQGSEEAFWIAIKTRAQRKTLRNSVWLQMVMLLVSQIEKTYSRSKYVYETHYTTAWLFPRAATRLHGISYIFSDWKPLQDPWYMLQSSALILVAGAYKDLTSVYNHKWSCPHCLFSLKKENRCVKFLQFTPMYLVSCLKPFCVTRRAT